MSATHRWEFIVSEKQTGPVILVKFICRVSSRIACTVILLTLNTIRNKAFRKTVNYRGREEKRLSSGQTTGKPPTYRSRQPVWDRDFNLGSSDYEAGARIIRQKCSVNSWSSAHIPLLVAMYLRGFEITNATASVSLELRVDNPWWGYIFLHLCKGRFAKPCFRWKESLRTMKRTSSPAGWCAFNVLDQHSRGSRFESPLDHQL